MVRNESPEKRLRCSFCCSRIRESPHDRNIRFVSTKHGVSISYAIYNITPRSCASYPKYIKLINPLSREFSVFITRLRLMCQIFSRCLSIINYMAVLTWRFNNYVMLLRDNTADKDFALEKMSLGSNCARRSY